MKGSAKSIYVFVVAFAGFPGEFTRAQDALPAQNIGAKVYGIFSAKCAGCHGSDLAKPKGRFGYVLDLKKVTANPEMVIPLRPQESELWDLVQRDEMPPADSPTGALTPAQKEVIRTWIAAGAPDAAPGTSEFTTAAKFESVDQATYGSSYVDRTVRWLGKFHLLVLHFPIALIVAAGIGEAWSVWQRNPRPSELVQFCLYLAAIAAIPTAVLGWLFAAAGNGIASPQLLMLHRWLGTATAVWLVVTAVCAGRDARRGFRTRGVSLLVASGAILTAFAAHLGGLLAHGEDFLDF